MDDIKCGIECDPYDDIHNVRIDAFKALTAIETELADRQSFNIRMAEYLIQHDIDPNLCSVCAMCPCADKDGRFKNGKGCEITPQDIIDHFKKASE
jgi:hypothetical protein